MKSNSNNDKIPKTFFFFFFILLSFLSGNLPSRHSEEYFFHLSSNHHHWSLLSSSFNFSSSSPSPPPPPPPSLGPCPHTWFSGNLDSHLSHLPRSVILPIMPWNLPIRGHALKMALVASWHCLLLPLGVIEINLQNRCHHTRITALYLGKTYYFHQRRHPLLVSRHAATLHPPNLLPHPLVMDPTLLIWCRKHWDLASLYFCFDSWWSFTYQIQLGVDILTHGFQICNISPCRK